MLARVFDLNISSGAMADLGWQRHDLLEVLIRLFCDRLFEAVHRGLSRRYVDREDDLKALRGRLNVKRQFTVLVSTPQKPPTGRSSPPGELIDHGEHAELPPIVCSIHDEVIGPDVIGPARPQTDAGSVVEPQPAPFRLLLWDLQPLPPPDALDPLGVHGANLRS